MLTTYDRYMRELRLKRTEARLQREDDLQDDREVMPSVLVALIVTRAEKGDKP